MEWHSFKDEVQVLVRVSMHQPMHRGGSNPSIGTIVSIFL